ncbi:Serine/threonine-protein kinase ULK4 [Willisornis vidua]|uniref:Serine/threonine-protein kinase ULK4 n=1 Tax=Willisornis vidua TaxID=1566151 RepID=A0ABQ9D7U4_9PASS|nr:Serine/threonine-protein kinase ULK4 [Willisornis vidua]
MGHQDSILGNTMQTAIALLNNIVANKSTNMMLLFKEGLAHHLCSLLTAAVALCLDAGDKGSTKPASALLLSLLDILQCVLGHTAGVVRQALQLPSEDTEIFASASQCLSLLVQLYGGSSQERMSPENMDSFAEVLKSKKDTQQLKLLLRIVKRLVVTKLAFLLYRPSFVGFSLGE